MKETKVCAKPGASLDEATLRQRLGDRLAGYKVPRYIAFRAEPLPQNASGKLHKLKTREGFMRDAGLAEG